MEFNDVLNSRRSVRNYKSDAIPNDIIINLINDAIKAPSAMNMQPWAFGILTDANLLRNYSEQIKQSLLANIDNTPWFLQYREYFESPDYHVFYNAPAMIVIYATTPGPISQVDCTLAAENLMLSARNMGLGTCWIGFANELLDQPKIKKELGVPSEYKVIAPIIVGYPDGLSEAPEKNPVNILFRK
ncbi:MAG: nitroreductase family protein [Armatimonadota bacterium]